MMLRHYSKTKWPFTELPSTVVYTSRDVMEKREPILLVTHDQDDGAWQFYAERKVPDNDARIIALDEIVNSDPSVIELADLPRGWIAVRESPAVPWQRHPIALNVRAVINAGPRDSEADHTLSTTVMICPMNNPV
jgi:hypothetical protein